MQQQEEAWTDAADDSDLNAVHPVDNAAHPVDNAVRPVDNALEKVDERMLCDIQSLADRQVAKAHMLLGICEGWMHIRTMESR